MDVFVYGTLTDPDQVDDLLEEWAFGRDAVLHGFHRVEGEYPTLAPGGRTEGRILRTPEVDRLDRYEGVDRGLYARVQVPNVEGGWVETYVGDPDRLGVDATWPGDGDLGGLVEWYVRRHGVDVRPQGDREV
jgi:gamma-glutamylcyclotransferase (GGCT)/AIG2-like uncharacterized protein YtfP